MRLLDLFCGAGGAAKGYHDAGVSDIVGVDIAPQPRYPFEFVQSDALEFLAEHHQEFDCFHASPPCQGYSVMNNLPWLRNREYPLLILPTMEMFEAIGKPYVLENVMGARHGAKGLSKRGLGAHGLKAGWLCGAMFGRPLYFHRLFATNFPWLIPGHPKHRSRILAGRLLGNRARTVGFQELGAHKEGSGIGHAKGWHRAAEAKGIDWMTRNELSEAIPPVYTEYIGRWLLHFGEARLAETTPEMALR